VKVTTDSGDGYFGISNEEQPMKECVIRRCHTLEKRELTAGPWEVKDEKVTKLFDLLRRISFMIASILFAESNFLYLLKNSEFQLV